ncbi:MAG: hypothetical protein PHE78_08045, partial [Candidatus Gastranaerophilales bacterium]|nr:hypothetical protein [Candidatus Gastranaerophilales bacterium]
MKLNSFERALEYCDNKNIKLFEAFQKEESNLKDVSVLEIRNIMAKNLSIMKETIENGLANDNKSITGLSGEDSTLMLSNSNFATPFG